MSFAELLSESALLELASRRSYDAGCEYFDEGRVLRLEAGAEHARAKVDGTDDAPYTVRLRLASADRITWGCTCPHAEDGSFCKHLVATAVAWKAWNAAQAPAAPAPAPKKSVAVQSESDLDAAVEAMMAVQMGAPTAAPQYTLPDSEEVAFQWKRPGEVVTIGGMAVSCGLLYFGARPKGLRALVPHALLDPRYKLAPFADMGHWFGSAYPDYISLTDTGRRAYVRWLADGRQDPFVHPLYVQLYFTGLEYRVLVDGHLPEFEQDRPLIQAELTRLLDIYGARMAEQLRRAMRQLRDWLRLHTADATTATEFDPVEDKLGQVGPQHVRIAAARTAARQEPMSARLAFEWAMTDAKASVRGYVLTYPVPLFRCFENLLAQYRPGGVPLAMAEQVVDARYAPMTSTLSAHAKLPPMLAELRAAAPSAIDQQLIAQLMADSAAQLEAYSYFCVRNPGTSKGLEANLLLPVMAMPAAMAAHVTALRESRDLRVLRLEELLTGFVNMPVSDADEVLLKAPTPRLVESLVRVLESYGLGMEPSGSKLPRQLTPDLQVCVYPVDGQCDTAQSVVLHDAMLAALRLVLSVLQPGESTLEQSRAYLEDWFNEATSAPGCLRMRLRARAELEMLGPKSTAGVRKGLGDLPDTLEAWLHRGVLGAAQVHPAQAAPALKALQKAYKLLDRDPKEVFGDLHAHAAQPRGARIAARAAETGKFKLDANRLAQLQAETAQTDQLLAGIFTDTEEGETPPMAPAPVSVTTAPVQSPAVDTAAAPRLWGLDTVHSEFARAILERSSWSRDDLKAMAKQRGRMLDGALERINDAAVDATGLPLCEGEDPVDVNTELLDYLTA